MKDKHHNSERLARHSVDAKLQVGRRTKLCGSTAVRAEPLHHGIFQLQLRLIEHLRQNRRCSQDQINAIASLGNTMLPLSIHHAIPGISHVPKSSPYRSPPSTQIQAFACVPTPDPIFALLPNVKTSHIQPSMARMGEKKNGMHVKATTK